MQQIRIGIVGYGNLARGAEKAIRLQPDMQLVAVFSRRENITSESGTPVYSMKDIPSFVNKIDIMFLCGGSANDLMEQAQEIGSLFHVIDSFDTHAKVEEHFQAMDKVAKESGKIAFISFGWDPGLFSLQRLLGESILPQGKNYTFWGRGISQGHSNAVRRIPGVKDAKQYTVPKEEYLENCRAGATEDISATESHVRECFVVLEDDANPAEIENTIRTMPNYFEGYETVVHFISEEEMARDHAAMPHGGFVLRVGQTAENEKEVVEFNLRLDSNPNFTASTIIAYTRAIMRFAEEGRSGCFTILDIPISYISPKNPIEQRKLL